MNNFSNKTIQRFFSSAATNAADIAQDPETEVPSAADGAE